MEKVVEKHVTIEDSVFAKLKVISKRENRTMRAVLHRLINSEFDKDKK